MPRLLIRLKTRKLPPFNSMENRNFRKPTAKGKSYVNIEDKSEISVINPKTLKVEKSWSIAPGEEPSGLALWTMKPTAYSAFAATS